MSGDHAHTALLPVRRVIALLPQQGDDGPEFRFQDAAGNKQFRALGEGSREDVGAVSDASVVPAQAVSGE
ncbi:MAG: hypothetical protein QOE76_684 [Frankiales bacterium]|nr:hypothetical protein [Frankiales bacterium]